MKKITFVLLTIFTTMVFHAFALAADPGTTIPAASEASDQKPGSILFFTLYTSKVTSTNLSDTALSITNTSSTQAVRLHLFFVAGMGSAEDGFLCLTPNQTTSFLASEVDPEITGYLVVVAVDSEGCPINQNVLIGSAYVRMVAAGARPSTEPVVYQARLNAESFAAISVPFCNKFSSSVTLRFDGIQYNRAPRVLALDTIRSAADLNSALIVLTSVDGDLSRAGTPLSTIQGLMYDDQENLFSFQFAPAKPQFIGVLSNTFPRITPRFETAIPSGHTGWMRLWMQADRGMLGVVVNHNPKAGIQAGAFNGGSNLHHLTLSAASSITIPVFPPAC